MAGADLCPENGTLKRYSPPEVTNLGQTHPWIRTEAILVGILVLCDQLLEDEHKDVGGESVEWSKAISVPSEKSQRHIQAIQLYSISHSAYVTLSRA